MRPGVSPESQVNQVLLEDFGIIGGYDLGQDNPQLDSHVLIAVTEMNTRAEIDGLVDALRKATA